MKWYSEYGEDEWITRHVSLPESGVYVDVGAAHPHVHSNTAFLRRRGWSGVAIDGNTEWSRYWITPFVPAVISTVPHRVHFHADGNPWLSKIRDGEPNTQARTIESVLAEANIRKIDVLNLSVEGSEYDAAKTLMWDSHKPKIVIARYNTVGTGRDYRLMEFLTASGNYQMAGDNPVSFIFKRRN